MICPKCHSIIPDDSKFCPDCGETIMNIDLLKKQAHQIVTSYKDGYEHFLNLGVIPPYSEYLSIEGLNVIISKADDIKKKHSAIRGEYIQKQQRNEEEQRIREAASRIASVYARGYQFMVNNGSLPQYSPNLSVTDCKKIISKETVIKQKHQELSEHQENNGMGITIIIVVAIIFGLILAFSGSSDNSSKYEVEYPPEDSVCIEVVEELVEEVAAPEDIFPYGVDSLL